MGAGLARHGASRDVRAVLFAGRLLVGAGRHRDLHRRAEDRRRTGSRAIAVRDDLRAHRDGGRARLARRQRAPRRAGRLACPGAAPSSIIGAVTLAAALALRRRPRPARGGARRPARAPLRDRVLAGTLQVLRNPAYLAALPLLLLPLRGDGQLLPVERAVPPRRLRAHHDAGRAVRLAALARAARLRLRSPASCPIPRPAPPEAPLHRPGLRRVPRSGSRSC